MKHARYLAPAAAVALVLPLSGCGESEVPSYDTSVSSTDIEEMHPVIKIAPGESAFVGNISVEEAKPLLEKIRMVDHIYPNGPTDGNAPLITTVPSRVNIQVSLSGESPQLNNDAGCETFRVDGFPSQIGALAIGGKEGGVTISWPEQPDGSSSNVYVCSFQEMEPGSDHGAILFAKGV